MHIITKDTFSTCKKNSMSARDGCLVLTEEFIKKVIQSQE